MSDLQLHGYQEVARDFLRGGEEKGKALFLDMGLGKTATTLSALEPRHLPALVIAPKRVAEEVWTVETDLWRPDLTIQVAKGSPAARQAALAAGADITTLGRDNLKDLWTPQRDFPFRWRTIIIDELSGFKNRASQRWKMMKKVCAATPVEHVWGLTGTPTPNGLLDLWAQVALLDNGARLGKNITTYRNRYFVPGRRLPNGIITDWDLRPEAEQHIYENIEDICLSMETDGRIELPNVTHNSFPVTLPPKVKRVYEDVKRDLVVDLREIFDGEIHTAANAAVLTSKLSQISAGFMYVDDADLNDMRYTRLHDEKTRAVEEIVEGANGSPVLVFYRFRPEREALRAAFPTARTIDEPGVVKEWNAGRVPVLLAHPASAGHGLNLQHGGHTIVWTSMPWSLEEWQQGNKRLARQGQKHPVIIHSLEGRGTIDPTIRARLNDKTTVQDSLLEYLESPI